MNISARNQLQGTITSITVGDVLVEVVLQVGDHEVVAVITKSSADRLGLAVGKPAVAIIKSTEVMIGTLENA